MLEAINDRTFSHELFPLFHLRNKDKIRILRESTKTFIVNHEAITRQLIINMAAAVSFRLIHTLSECYARTRAHIRTYRAASLLSCRPEVVRGLPPLRPDLRAAGLSVYAIITQRRRFCRQRRVAPRATLPALCLPADKQPGAFAARVLYAATRRIVCTRH